MRVITGFHDLGIRTDGPAVTIGNFDGVHRGHQNVMLSTRDEARRRGVDAIVCTFDPHTAVVLRPEIAPPSLQTLAQRLEAIAGLGIDITVVLPFDAQIASIGPGRFVDEFLIGELHVGSLHVSQGFSFGRSSAGRISFLEERSQDQGFRVVTVPPVLVDAVPVSSTRIRDLIAAGRIEDANELLTRPFALSGHVVRGAGRGHRLDAPTANLEVRNGCLPATGVYAARVNCGAGTYGAVANIGCRPTFDGESPIVVESHLLDFDGDLYGQDVELALLTRLRGEKRFESPAALAAQIQSDIEAARVVITGS